MNTITIHITDLPLGGITVNTTSGEPCSGLLTTPAETLAHELLMHCTINASDVRYWQKPDACQAFARRLLDREGFALAVTHEVRSAARHALGLPALPNTEGTP